MLLSIQNAWIDSVLNILLGRRYLRFFSFIELFQQAYSLSAKADNGETRMLRVMKITESSLLGLYILMEDLTMVSTYSTTAIDRSDMNSFTTWTFG